MTRLLPLMLMCGCVDLPGVRKPNEGTETPTPVDSEVEPETDDSDTQVVLDAEPESTPEVPVLENASFEYVTIEGASVAWEGPGGPLMPVDDVLTAHDGSTVYEMRAEALTYSFPVDLQARSSVIGIAVEGYTYEVSGWWAAPSGNALPAYIDIVFGDRQVERIEVGPGTTWSEQRVSRVAGARDAGQEVRVVLGAEGSIGTLGEEFMVWFDDLSVSVALSPR